MTGSLSRRAGARPLPLNLKAGDKPPRYWVLLGIVLFLPSLAFAEIGRVSAIQGEAAKYKSDSEGKYNGADSISLALGSPIQAKDTVIVSKGGSLKITLSDGSIVKL